MSREIKFRVYRPYPEPVMYYFSLWDLVANKFNRQPLIDYPRLLEENLMQKTGLKDKNGVDIYESDIVEFDMSEYQGNGKIMFKDSSFIVTNADFYNEEESVEMYWYLCDVYEYSIIEVIGNIHENPELLEEQKENE